MMWSSPGLNVWAFFFFFFYFTFIYLYHAKLCKRINSTCITMQMTCSSLTKSNLVNLIYTTFLTWPFVNLLKMFQMFNIFRVSMFSKHRNDTHTEWLLYFKNWIGRWMFYLNISWKREKDFTENVKMLTVIDCVVTNGKYI